MNRLVANGFGSSVAQAVIDATDRGLDPFRLVRHAPPSRDDVERIVADATRGVDASLAKRLAESLEGTGRQEIRGIDEVTAVLMASAGVDPIVLAWLANITFQESMIVEDGATVAVLDTWPRHDSAFGTRVAIGCGVVWRLGGIVQVGVLPEVVRIAAKGRRLRELVSHPVLDERNLIIRDVDDRGRLKVLEGAASDEAEPMTPWSLACIRVPGRR